jgi:hypothetical protein
LVLPEDVPELAGFFPFGRERDIAELDLKGRFESGLVVADKRFSLLGMSEEDEKGAAVDALQGFLHLLCGDDTPVVLAQDHIDRNAQPGKVEEALRADDKDDDEERPEPERDLLAESKHMVFP